MGVISDAIWKRYKNLIGKGHDSFNQDEVTFVKFEHGLDRWQEDPVNVPANYSNKNLKVLIQYNYFHSWPTNRDDESGQKDRQTAVFLFNREYLQQMGQLDAHGNFVIEPNKDFFIHRGQEYRIEGDTFIAQAKNDPMGIMVIVRRQEVPTGQARAWLDAENTDREIPGT